MRQRIHPERVCDLNDRPVRDGGFVLYWMQASQREHFNDALEFAAGRANEMGRPLVAGFGLTDDYPEANARHYAFLLEGLRETRNALAGRGVQLVVLRDSPPKAALTLASEAACVVCDCGYLRHQRQWRDEVADHAPCLVTQVEADVVVPVETASDKLEFAARTIRPKIHRQLDRFLTPLRRAPLRHDSLGIRAGGIELADGLLGKLRTDHSVAPVDSFRGGTGKGRKLLRRFIRDRLAEYHVRRNDPTLGIESHMSPYLHFGQVSPVWISLQVRSADAPAEAKAAYLEELIVRRELSMNFCRHNPSYDRYEGLPDWARKTLAHHARDRRPYVYTREQLDAAETHDAYWNAAQNQMRRAGKMHNYMRMYWGKKILEWSASPAEAFATALWLNNRYELDGRDPNSYAGVAWCFGQHDRPWARRAIFGTVRYMNAAGLERKFDLERYLADWLTG